MHIAPANLAAPKTSPSPTRRAALRVRARGGGTGEKSSGQVLVVGSGGGGGGARKPGESAAVPKPATGAALGRRRGVFSSGEAMAEGRDEAPVVGGGGAVINESAAAAAMASTLGVEVEQDDDEDVSEVDTESTSPGLTTGGRMPSPMSITAGAFTRAEPSEAEAPAGEATAERDATSSSREVADGEVRGMGLVFLWGKDRRVRQNTETARNARK